MNQVDKEIEEFLRLHPAVPLKKPKAPPPKLEVAATAEPSVEVLRKNAQRAQERLHEEELRVIPSWLRNRRLYGRSRSYSAEEQREIRNQTRLDDAIIAAKARKRAEEEHLAALDEFKMGLW